MSDDIPVDSQGIVTESEVPVSEPVHAVSNDEDSQRLEELDKQAQRLRAELNSESGHPAPQTDEEKRDIDARSVYIGNVDYGATPYELREHFGTVGNVQRVTILMNRFTGQPKGFAYLEFADYDAVNKAVATLDGSTFRERELKVTAKRTNIPGISTTNRGGSSRGGRGGRGGRGARGRGRGRGGFRGGNRFTPY
ncbi:polyadenylate-binding protein 2 [Scheffersomyces amazonensis]|uniref:polyadenylate-binding protein 2 n=1 Tax=Scheffersomyces amazonensis TaxID=1078765 RepID=UPI00315D7E7B